MGDSQWYLTRIMELLLILLMTIATAYGQDADSSSAMCVPFPHSHLFCGQYINVNTMVYIDPNVFNYTEANNIIEIVDGAAFSPGIVNSCRWILMYTVCLSIYPQCNISTQKLVPPCIEDCLEYANICRNNFIILTTAIMFADNPLEIDLELLVLNCSAPFRAFGSVNIDIDTENCYNFNFPPIFVFSTTSVIESSSSTRLLMLQNQSSSTDYCSELQRRNVSVTCRAVGIPEPQVDILVNGTIVEPFNETENEVVIRLAPTIFGEVVMFECQASTMTTTTSLAVNLSYTCCMDDRGVRYSIGQEFMTTNCLQCSCGNGGSISCDQSQCTSNTSGISAGITVIIILGVVLVIVTIAVLIGCIWWSVRGRYSMKITVRTDKPPQLTENGVPQNANADGGVMPGMNSTGYSSVNDSHLTAIAPGEHTADLSAEPYCTPRINLTEALTSSGPEEFKPTEDIIISTLNDYLLEDFIIPHDHLMIFESLGEGAFGKVFHGFLRNESDQAVEEVAIKTVKDCKSMDEINLFISESVIMKNFKHRNVLGLIGISVGVEDEIAVPYIVLPFMANGDLKRYLQHQRNNLAVNNPESLFKVISYSTLVKICCDICHGMEYLALNRYVHRDLAARNCMVDKDLVVKVADFGLSRDIYSDEYYRLRHKAAVPIKWMPPESLYDGFFNEMTDVWAFGVCCWEVFSLGAVPYAGVDFKDILKYVESGKRLSKTALCGDKMYQIMLSCWQLKNSDRPKFSTLAEQLEQHYSDAPESLSSLPRLVANQSATEITYINYKPE